MRVRTLVHHPAWRHRPALTAARFVLSHVRRHIPSARTVVVPYDAGQSRIVADLHTSFGLAMYRYGLRYGPREPDFDLVGRYLQPGEVFIDGGANIGLFTLIAAHRVGRQGTVYAFEPSSWARSALQKNLALNGFHWVRVLPCALHAAACSDWLITWYGEGTGLGSFAPAATTGSHSELVALVCLDDILEQAERARVSLIKLDVEGAEVHALRGAAGLIHDVGPDFLVECIDEHLMRQGASLAELLALFEQAGYRPFKAVWDRAGQVGLMPTSALELPPAAPNVFFTRKLDRVISRGIRLLDE